MKSAALLCALLLACGSSEPGPDTGRFDSGFVVECDFRTETSASCSGCPFVTFFMVHGASEDGRSYVFANSCIGPGFEVCRSSSNGAVLAACDGFCDRHGPDSGSTYCVDR